jgi:hypothetical protein
MHRATTFLTLTLLTACGGAEPERSRKGKRTTTLEQALEALDAQADQLARLEARIDELEQRDVLEPSALDGYATESWVADQGYATHAWVDGAYISLAEFQASTVVGLADVVSVDLATDEVVFSGVNVRIDNGLGNTLSTNGLGNLILGYNQQHGAVDRSGSHSLVIGDYHQWSGAGIIVTGSDNDVFADGAAVLGGWAHTVEGPWSVALGGMANQVPGGWAVSIGGNVNTVSGTNSAAIAGRDNVVSGQGAVVVGGAQNEAAADQSVAVSGSDNLASGTRSLVLGGSYNETTSYNGVAP